MAEPGWVRAIPLDDLWEGELVGLRVAGVDLLVVHLGDGLVLAYADHCPHAGSRLSDGHLRAGILTCATHLWEFDLRTGLGVNPATCALRRYPAEVRDGDVMVQL